MAYNGLGMRLTSCVLGTNTHYASDEQLPLTNRMGNKVITVLFGLGPIAEKTTDWNYLLTNGASLPRQLTDMNGEITLSVRYSPWGKAMDISGLENFDMSYISTLTDFATGLMYIGNGQYFDPETGRFLTRGVNQNSPNPYVPWDPMMTILGPLGLVSANYARKRIKRVAAVGFLALFLEACGRILLIVAVIILVAITLNACGTHNAQDGVDTPPGQNGGGGMSNEQTSPTLKNVTFNGNVAAGNESVVGKGGGIYNYVNADPTLTNVTFSGNTAGIGGGMYSVDSNNIKIFNSIFWGNGTEIVNSNSVPLIEDSVVQGGCTANVASPVHKARIVISIRMKLQRIPYSCRSSCGSDGWVRWSVGPSSSAQEHSPPGRYSEETGISWIFSHGRLLFGKLNKKGAAFPGGKSHLQVLQWAIVSCAKNVKPTPNGDCATSPIMKRRGSHKQARNRKMSWRNFSGISVVERNTCLCNKSSLKEQ